MCREGHAPKTPHTLQQCWIQLMNSDTLHLHTISEQELQTASGGSLLFGGARVMRTQAARIAEINQGRENLAIGNPPPYPWPPEFDVH